MAQVLIYINPAVPYVAWQKRKEKKIGHINVAS